MADEMIPVFRVADASRSVAWFEQLGFEHEWVHRFERAAGCRAREVHLTDPDGNRLRVGERRS